MRVREKPLLSVHWQQATGRPGQVRSGQVGFVTRPKPRTLRATAAYATSEVAALVTSLARLCASGYARIFEMPVIQQSQPQTPLKTTTMGRPQAADMPVLRGPPPTRRLGGHFFNSGCQRARAGTLKRSQASLRWLIGHQRCPGSCPSQ